MGVQNRDNPTSKLVKWILKNMQIKGNEFSLIGKSNTQPIEKHFRGAYISTAKD